MNVVLGINTQDVANGYINAYADVLKYDGNISVHGALGISPSLGFPSITYPEYETYAVAYNPASGYSPTKDRISSRNVERHRLLESRKAINSYFATNIPSFLHEETPFDFL